MFEKEQFAEVPKAARVRKEEVGDFAELSLFDNDSQARSTNYVRICSSS